MAATYWIKLYHEVLRDPKMGRLPDRLWRRVIELFLMAGENDDDGLLPDVEDMAWTLRLDEDALREDLAALAEFDIVTQTDDGWCVTKFAVRQAPVPGASRTRHWRERVRKSQYDGHEPVTDGDETSDETVTTEAEPCDEPVTDGDDTVTIRPTDTDTDTDTDTESPNGGGEPPGGVSFQDWNDRLRAAKGNERATIMLELFMALYPKHDRPAYGRLGGAAKQIGGWSRLAQLLWEAGARPPVGDVLDFVTKVAKGKAGDRRNGKNGARAMPSDDEWLAQIKEERKSEATSGGQRG